MMIGCDDQLLSYSRVRIRFGIHMIQITLTLMVLEADDQAKGFKEHSGGFFKMDSFVKMFVPRNGKNAFLLLLNEELLLSLSTGSPTLRHQKKNLQFNPQRERENEAMNEWMKLQLRALSPVESSAAQATERRRGERGKRSGLL